MPFHMAEDMLRLRKRLRPDLLVQKRSGFFGRKLSRHVHKLIKGSQESVLPALSYGYFILVFQ